MDEAGIFWYIPAMMIATHKIPAWQLYGEDHPFPDLLHIERIVDRAAGLDWQITAHRHLHLHQMFLILCGQVWVSVDGNNLSANPPVLMNVPREAVHGFRFSAGTEGYVLTLPASDFPELFGAEAATATLLRRPFLISAPEGIADTFARITVLYEGEGALRRLRLRAEVIALCCAASEAAGIVGAAPEGGDPRILRFGILIREHLAQGWQLADYSGALAVSERHLRRLCLQATGLSAHAFIESIRLHEACRLLAYTRMRVQEVGFALGFDDPAYFARTFRRGTGMSPGDYRAKLE
jgi:AraC family transcriptional activator of pobA